MSALTFGGACLQAAPVTFNKEIAPLLFKHCAACHRPGEIAPFSLLTYADAAKRAEQLAEITACGTMPPWKPIGAADEFVNDRRLAAAEIALVRQWVTDGCPEGNPADLPRPPVFPEGWQLGKPDVVVTVPEPIRVPADGRDLHTNVVLPFAVPPGKYLKAAEFRPGNPRVVHHAVLYMDTTGEALERDRATHRQGFIGITPPGKYLPGSLGIWAPGRNAMPLPKGLAMEWPAGAVLVLHLHLVATGKPETEQSSIGFYFSSEPSTRSLIEFTLVDVTIDIPPGEKKYRTHDRKMVPVDAEMLSIFPHMHLLGREMKIEAHLPDGSRQSLLQIDDWDYNWQDLYQFTTPVRLPAGTIVTLDAVYDNSADNPQNPRHPPVRVRWGEDAENEMCLAFICLSPIVDRKPVDAARQPALTAWRKADLDGDRRLSVVELVAALGGTSGPNEIAQVVVRFDRDGDRHLNFDEFFAAWQANSPR